MFTSLSLVYSRSRAIPLGHAPNAPTTPHRLTHDLPPMLRPSIHPHHLFSVVLAQQLVGLQGVVHLDERRPRGAEALLGEEPRLEGLLAAEEDAMPDVVLDVGPGEFVPHETEGEGEAEGGVGDGDGEQRPPDLVADLRICVLWLWVDVARLLRPSYKPLPICSICVPGSGSP